jgi:DNA modification methylase
MDQAKLQHLKHLAYERRFPAGIIRADAINIPLQDGTVDLVVTSPPYFALRSYIDGGEHYDGQIGSEPTPQDFLEALWAVTAECARVLKPSGSIWVNLGDKYSGSSGQNNNGKGSSTLNGHGGEGTAKDQGTKAAPVKVETSIPAKSLMGLPWRYAIGCIDQLGLILRAEVIWSKPNGLPESVTDRVRRSHEQWFHFTKEPRYYAAVDEVREATTDDKRPGAGGGKWANGIPEVGRGASTTTDNRGRLNQYANPLGKLPGSVWTIASEPLKVPDHLGVDHFAAYPQEWPRRIILGWSPPGICTRCGDGRRPVVERTTSGHDNNATSAIRVNGAMGGTKFNAMKAANPATITGYACQCPEPDAPTRPAVVLDPFGGTGTTAMVARALGRYPVHLDLSADYLRLARWRIFRSSHDHKTIERTNEQRPDRPLKKRQLRPKDLKAAKKAGMEYG